MLGALRLYADNLLCMDLCGWSGVDAIKLLGEEVKYIVNAAANVMNTVTTHVASFISFACIVPTCSEGAWSEEEEGHRGDMGLQAHGGS